MTNIDKKVAELVMGWKKNGVIGSGDFEEIVWKIGKENTVGFYPATDISQAFDVVNKMIADGYWVNIFGMTTSTEWGVTMIDEDNFMKDKSEEFTEYDKSLPLAICKAAIKAKEAK